MFSVLIYDGGVNVKSYLVVVYPLNKVFKAKCCYIKTKEIHVKNVFNICVHAFFDIFTPVSRSISSSSLGNQ